MQMFAIVLSLAFTAAALVITTRAVTQMVRVIRIGQPASRSDHPAARTVTMLKETVLHTRMLQWTWIGILHWFVYAAFLFLSSAVMAGFVQLFDPYFEIPVFGKWYIYGWSAEFLGLLGTLGIIGLIIYRQVKNPARLGRQSRFFGSRMWMAYFVEAMVLIESAAILFIRGAEYKLHDATALHFPLSHFVGEWFYPDGENALKNIVWIVATVKVVSAMVWLIVISSFLTMGIAWHRFTAWPNIWFKRESSGQPALGAMKPLTSGGKPVNFEDLEDMDEDTLLGVGAVEDFSWKGILDFTTCTECGRCQSQCPAWNTEKPLSPKLLVMGLRDHAYDKAPYLNAGSEEDRTALPAETLAAAERSLIGKASGDEWFYNPDGGDFVIDEDALWSCTNCGACVQQCPVDIEHVDHIMDMRRYQVLVESNFPAELNGLFKGLENKGNPWNMNPKGRLEWAQGLDFDVPVLGEDAENMDDYEWLFWVGCAGAYEDRAKKTTRAVAELLDMAEVKFAVLGNGETCTGDPARRAGNEFVFQGLATQNVETFKEMKVKKVVSTCAHCFNTLKNEYKEFGIELEVVHHTQLLNRLVREKRLTPVAGQGANRSITYHDPCFLGRHNKVYSPPRELLQVIPNAEVKEMPRNSEKSFCCGAGGARMWMEEKIGERINVNRTKEAVATGADQIAVGCPFCRVMLSDGLTAQQSKGEAREEVEVLDVAQLLLASVKGEGYQPQKTAPAAKKSGPVAGDVATKAEPSAGDVTQSENAVTDTEDVGAGAEASGGSSLFDTPAQEAPAAQKPTTQEPAAQGGGSLFDDSSSLFDSPDEAASSEATAQSTSGDVQDDTPAASATEASAPAEQGSGSLFDEGGSLFDTPAEAAKSEETTQSQAGDVQDDTPVSEAAEKTEPDSEPETAPEPDAGPESEISDAPAGTSAEPATEIGSGSLFDLEAPAPAAPTKSAETKRAEDSAPGEPEEPQAAADDTGNGAAATESDESTGGPVTSLHDIKAKLSDDGEASSASDASDDAEAPRPSGDNEGAPSEADTDEPDEPDETAEPAGGKSKDSAQTPAEQPTHQPATDKDIGEAGSLFDL